MRLSHNHTTNVGTPGGRGCNFWWWLAGGQLAEEVAHSGDRMRSHSSRRCPLVWPMKCLDCLCVWLASLRVCTAGWPACVCARPAGPLACVHGRLARLRVCGCMLCYVEWPVWAGQGGYVWQLARLHVWGCMFGCKCLGERVMAGMFGQASLHACMAAAGSGPACRPGGGASGGRNLLLRATVAHPPQATTLVSALNSKTLSPTPLPYLTLKP
eukprot:358341-Chlamydomonas_euryale.AAC.5